jgi:predicted RNase H-like HicB family nuclease
MTYTFKVSLQEEGDGRWSAWIESLPGCATWGYTKDDALQCLHEAAVLVLEGMIECGESIPAEVESGGGMEVDIHL